MKVQDDREEWSNEESDTLEVRIYVPANEIPSVSIITPTNSTEISGEISCIGIALDNNGDIEKVEGSIDGGPWMQISIQTNWMYLWDSETVENGQHRLSVRNYDGEDYSGVSVITVSVNNEEDKDDESWYEEPVYLGWITAVLIVIVIIAVLFIRKRNEEYYNGWDDEDYYEED